MTILYRYLLRPLFFLVDPEVAHRLIHYFVANFGRWRLLQWAVRKVFMVRDPRLQIRVGGLMFPNPVGLAAGFDKAGDMTPLLSCAGFGFLEIGTVTARPWQGNPKPRVFRLPGDGALINRMGLNNPGADAVVNNLRRAPATVPVGISVAKTPDPTIMDEAGVQDFVDGVIALYREGDYLALNISCPNTCEGKTFEDQTLLDTLLVAIRLRESDLNIEHTPIFLKISPDIPLSWIDGVIDICTRHLVSGLIIGNTTTAREGLTATEERLAYVGKGGLSGAPLRERALTLITYAYRATRGALPIMGCGGIFSAEDAYACIRAGASLVQVYTGMIYAGPTLMRDINRGLLRLLARDGFASVADAVGADQKGTARSD
jgi:dihydroorotate dehydrogenase